MRHDGRGLWAARLGLEGRGVWPGAPSPATTAQSFTTPIAAATERRARIAAHWSPPSHGGLTRTHQRLAATFGDTCSDRPDATIDHRERLWDRASEIATAPLEIFSGKNFNFRRSDRKRLATA